jgi:streptogramin lyase
VGGRRIFGAVALLGAGLVFSTTTAPPAVAAHGDTATFVDVDGQVDAPTRLAEGPDGMIWFTSTGNDRIGRLDPTIETFEAGVDQPYGIAAGPDGNLWFTADTAVGRITPAGVVTTYPDAQLQGGRDIVAGPDGYLWFTAEISDAIGRIDPDGSIDWFTDAGIDGPTGLGWSGEPQPPSGVIIPVLLFSNTGANDLGAFIPLADSFNFLTVNGLDGPGDIAPDGDGLVVASTGNDRVLRCPSALSCASRAADVEDIGPVAGTGVVGADDRYLWQASLDDDSVVARNVSVLDESTTFTPTDTDAISDLVPTGDGDLWFTSQANDRLGRIEVDDTPPVIEVTGLVEGAEHPRTAPPTLGLTCTDEVGGSGLVGCAASQEDQEAFDGQPVPDTGPGPQTLRASAVDEWGNVARLDVHHTVTTTSTCNGLPATAELAFGDDVNEGPFGEPKVVVGTPGDDAVDLGAIEVTLCLGGGKDTVRTSGSVIDGWLGPGNDVIHGTWGALVRGGTGADRFVADGGVPEATGGRGNDVMIGVFEVDVFDGGPGNDLLVGGKGRDELRGGSGRDVLNGGPGPDQLYGGDQNDVLFGLGASDSLFGDLGNDLLDGGSGNDFCWGGPGTDAAVRCHRTFEIP